MWKKPLKSSLATLVLAAIAVGLCSPGLEAQLNFKDGDRVCIIGNSLASRLQYSGWLESMIQSRSEGKHLTFRNLGFPGDQVAKRPRNKGYMTPEEYLTHCEADVIFAMFGYNESFAGEGGLESFSKSLNEMIDSYRELKPNGKTAPRIVLFSPIAHEDLGDRNFPDGNENNARLALYTSAIRQVAVEKNASFVDLFAASQALYQASISPLTLNGIHLNDEGNRLVGQFIASTLLNESFSVTSELEQLRQAVLDKNLHWFNRYRATDGNDVWGGRSHLKFVQGQTNREVLMHELIMFDIMTANRDLRIWTLLEGRDMVVDDSNVPSPVGVVSNVGGGSPSSNAKKEGHLNYISGEEGLKEMKVPEGFEVNLFADEERFPELVNPVQLSVDTHGRLWVAAWKTYPKWEPLKEMDDRLIILPDENRDGIADEAITFAKVHNPTGFEFWNGGVLVASQPDILFLKDTDGDNIADERTVYLEGIGSADTHHAANAFVYGPDGAIYWQSGIFLVNNIEHPYSPSLNTGSSGMFRFDPRRYHISYHANNSPNPHGISFDKWGYHYATDGTGGRAYQVVPAEKGFKMQKLLDMQVRPVPANGVISSENFPASYQGDFMIANTIGFLGIKQYELEREGSTGKVWGKPLGDLLSSSDKNFRPSDIEFGEDGALYFSDWHNLIIGHMQHNVRDPNRDHTYGRVYRMTYKDRPLQAPVKIAGASLEQLMKNLENPIDGVRYRTRIELSGRETTKVIDAANRWINQFDASNPEHAHHLLEGLWLHQQHNVRNTQLLTELLKSPEAHARNAARTVQHHWFGMEQAPPALIASVEMATESPASGVTASSADLVEVRIGTIPEKMKYDIKEFSVKAGVKVKVTFVNYDFMPHNIVFGLPESANEIGMAAIQLGADGFGKGFIPDNDKIITSSKLLQNKQEEIIEFTAPDKPGDYDFLCTFPGHHLLMRGIMKVVN
ncbi:GDSL-type esterase/lipase family protein [bacterium]|nr:GDSL-type esterase/lipase family protein [bacterium]